MSLHGTWGVFGCGNPHNKVGPNTKASAYEGKEEKDADDGGIHIEIICYATAHACYSAVGGAAGQFARVVIHTFRINSEELRTTDLSTNP